MGDNVDKRLKQTYAFSTPSENILTLYSLPLSLFTAVTICRTIAANTGSMGFKNSKNTFCSKLHGLSITRKIFFSLPYLRDIRLITSMILKNVNKWNFVVKSFLSLRNIYLGDTLCDKHRRKCPLGDYLGFKRIM
jgi:hypothetical protein